MDIDGITGNYVVVNYGGGVITGILARTIRVGQDRCTQHVIGIHVGAAHTFVDHISEAHLRIPLHIHTHSHEYGHYASVLADRAMTHGTHTRVDQDLRHSIFGGFTLLALIGLVHCLNEIYGVVVGNKLQRIGDAVDQILLTNHGWHSGHLEWLVSNS